MKIAVLDYTTTEVSVYETRKRLDTNEKVEKYLEKKGHKMSQCYYMTAKQIEINLIND